MNYAKTTVANEDRFTNEKVVPPKTWGYPDLQFTSAMSDPWYNLIMLLSGEICYTTQDFFRNRNYIPALMPITSEAVTSPMGLGSDSLPVSINLFDRTTYLADSMQFHLEYLLRQHPQGVFYIMPTFRGEDSDARHLNQFFHIEAELSGDLEDLIETIEQLLSSYVENILKHHGSLLNQYGRRVDHLFSFLNLVKNGVPRITFDDAADMLGNNRKFYTMLEDQKIGLSNLAEKKLMEHFKGPVWLTHLPKLGVPFYQADAADGRNALCADLLMGIGETVGSGQRHKGYKETLNAIQERGVDPSSYDWYLRMKDETPIQTSGFGIGLERFLLWVLDHDDIRDIPLIVRLKEMTSTP